MQTRDLHYVVLLYGTIISHPDPPQLTDRKWRDERNNNDIEDKSNSSLGIEEKMHVDGE